MIKQLKSDFSLSAVVAGFIVLLVGITSSGVLVFQAARSFGLDAQGASSWLGSLCLGMGLVGLVLSLRYRMPVLLAWSTPGAALLAGGLAGVSLAEVTGAFLFSGLLIFLSGITGLFEKIMNRIPMGLASALLGGILLKFCLETFLSLKSQPLLVGVMLLAYLLGKRLWPRYAVPTNVPVFSYEYLGELQRDGERLSLMRPDAPETRIDFTIWSR